jgi:hypothetical protein
VTITSLLEVEFVMALKLHIPPPLLDQMDAVEVKFLQDRLNTYYG